MKKIATSLLILLGLVNHSNAQIPAWIEDTVSIAPNYANDVFYSLKNDEIRTEASKNWHLAFSLSIADSAAVWANHNGGTSFVRVFNIHKDSSQWNTVTLGDTASADLVFNNDQGWFQGAFNAIPSADPFNYGWGKYDPTSHNIIGDSLFIVRANGVYYRVFIQQLESMIMKWTFKVGDFSGNETTHTISKTPDYTNRLFAYFDLAAAVDSNREPDINNWDILFTRYTTNAPGSGSGTWNNVVGVLKNKGVNITRVPVTHVDTAFLNNASYYGNWNPAISAIGYDWKTFVFPNAWEIADSNSYFIEDKSGNFWQMQFLNFGGSPTGQVIFRKRMVAPVFVQDVNSAVNRYEIFPVPTNNVLNIMLDAKQAQNASIQLMDLSGRTLTQYPIHLNSGFNQYVVPVSGLAIGNYWLKITGRNLSLTHQITVQH
ncbi:MAG: T9SS type A sorting domain-containing protein [Chitinophagaceae bacterium]|nr:T9SS type A sorting domain-containing protein [Chitinophagaceae bacterium]